METTNNSGRYPIVSGPSKFDYLTSHSFRKQPVQPVAFKVSMENRASEWEVEILGSLRECVNLSTAEAQNWFFFGEGIIKKISTSGGQNDVPKKEWIVGSYSTAIRTGEIQVIPQHLAHMIFTMFGDTPGYDKSVLALGEIISNPDRYFVRQMLLAIKSPLTLEEAEEALRLGCSADVDRLYTKASQTVRKLCSGWTTYGDLSSWHNQTNFVPWVKGLFGFNRSYSLVLLESIVLELTIRLEVYRHLDDIGRTLNWTHLEKRCPSKSEDAKKGIEAFIGSKAIWQILGKVANFGVQQGSTFEPGHRSIWEFSREWAHNRGNIPGF